jgi:allantoate deiminase
MEAAGLATRIDAAGNLSGVYGEGPPLTIGAPLDWGILGVMIGIALVEQRPPCAVEVAASTGGVEVDLEFQSEQGPVLEFLGLPLGVVETIAGRSLWDVRFEGRADHSGAPMNMRRDALACAAEWVGLVEHVAQTTEGLVATVAAIEIQPGAEDAIPKVVKATLDVRHAMDEVRERALNVMLDSAEHIAGRRSVKVTGEVRLNLPAVPMDFELLEKALESAGLPVHRMVSMISTQKAPGSMLLLRGAGEPRAEDVDAALSAGAEFLRAWCAD